MNIDQTVAGWLPDGKGTVERLHELAGRGWRPQDTELLDGFARKIQGWILSAAELLGDRPVAVSLRMACPVCAETFVYRHTGSELVRTWALRVSEDGCICQGCGAFWEPPQFEWLAKLLGCEPLPA